MYVQYIFTAIIMYSSDVESVEGTLLVITHDFKMIYIRERSYFAKQMVGAQHV